MKCIVNIRGGNVWRYIPVKVTMFERYKHVCFNTLSVKTKNRSGIVFAYKANTNRMRAYMAANGSSNQSIYISQMSG